MWIKQDKPGGCDGQLHVHTSETAASPRSTRGDFPLEIQAKVHQQTLGVTETLHFREISTGMLAKVLPV